MTGDFASVLKTAKVIRIFKKNFKLDYNNYRSISLLSNIEKILDKLMYEPFSEKWNQIAIFKNANKLHKSSWNGVNIDKTSYFFTC